MVREKTELADKKLASVIKLEEENAKLKTVVTEANKEVARLKKDKETLTEKVGDLTMKKGELEAYLGRLAEKLVLKLEGTSSRPTGLLLPTLYITVDSPFFRLCRIRQDFEAEIGRIETDLDPINSPVKDDIAMNVLRLESHLDNVVDYLACL